MGRLKYRCSPPPPPCPALALACALCSYRLQGIRGAHARVVQGCWANGQGGLNAGGAHDSLVLGGWFGAGERWVWAGFIWLRPVFPAHGRFCTWPANATRTLMLCYTKVTLLPFPWTVVAHGRQPRAPPCSAVATGGARRVLRWDTQPNSARIPSASRSRAGRLLASPFTLMDAMQAALPSALQHLWLL